MAKGHYANMTSSVCSRCHQAPRKGTHSYCADCLRVYNREWARRKRGSKPRPVAPVLQPGEKFCFKCERILPVDHFYRSRGKVDGRMSMCRDCDHLKQIAYRSKNRSKIRVQSREATRRYRALHPGYNARACAKAKRKRIARKIDFAMGGQS